MDKNKSNYVEAVVNDEDNGPKIVSVKVLEAVLWVTPHRPA